MNLCIESVLSMGTPKFLTQSDKGIMFSPNCTELSERDESLCLVPTIIASVLFPFNCSLFGVIQLYMSL